MSSDSVKHWLQNEETSGLIPTENNNIAKDSSGKLWFWDETGTAVYGPYDDLSSVLKGIEEYLKWLNYKIMIHENCPGCLERLESLTSEDRARIPLRKAVHVWKEATELLFELVQSHGWGNERVKKQEKVMDDADDALALAARSFAGLPVLSDEEISALEDIKDNLHVLSEGDDTSSHRALIDRLLSGRSCRGRKTS
jgi:hypothetical protein